MTVEVQFFTLNEVKLRNGRQDPSVWIVIEDIVYDVTDFIDEHPGGRDLVQEVAGKDATKDFLNAGHSGDALALLKTMKIGKLVKSDRKYEKKKLSGLTFLYFVTCGIFGH